MTRPSCVRCDNDNHEACDGGAWDERYKPVVCECFLLFHGGEPLEPCATCADSGQVTTIWIDGSGGFLSTKTRAEPCPTCRTSA